MNFDLHLIAEEAPQARIKGWTMTEVMGVAIINPRAILTPVQRLYINILKRGHHVLTVYREGNKVTVSTGVFSLRPETDRLEYVLEPKDDAT